MNEPVDNWPGGSTYIFQGTAAEDATGGTHVVTLTVSPTKGGEFELMYGQILVGNTATAQTAIAYIDDGTNKITTVLNAEDASDTVALAKYVIPQVSQVAVPATTTLQNLTGRAGLIVSGA